MADSAVSAPWMVDTRGSRGLAYGLDADVGAFLSPPRMMRLPQKDEEKKRWAQCPSIVLHAASEKKHNPSNQVHGWSKGSRFHSSLQRVPFRTKAQWERSACYKQLMYARRSGLLSLFLDPPRLARGIVRGMDQRNLSLFALLYACLWGLHL